MAESGSIPVKIHVAIPPFGDVSLCERCGCLVADQGVHDRFHSQQDLVNRDARFAASMHRPLK